MTIAELLLALVVLGGFYYALRPIQRWLESLFLRLSGASKVPSDKWVIDAEIKPNHKTKE